MIDPENTILDQTFSVPLDDEKFLIYAPLKRIAFITNAQLVNEIFDCCVDKDSASSNIRDLKKEQHGKKSPDNLAFLKELNFMQPEKLPVDTYEGKGIQYDSIVLFLINQCNLQCIYCYACASEYPLRKMSWDTAKAAVDLVIKEIINNQLSHMTLGFHGGGEPTLNQEILRKAVEYAHSIADKNDISLDISGSFNGYWSKSVLEYILDHFTNISISFDGLPEIQDRQRPTKNGQGSFQKVAETLHILDEVKFRYGIRMTITDDSVQHLAENIAFISEQFKPMQIQVEPVFEEGRAKRNRLAVKDLNMFIDQFIKAYRKAEEKGISIFYSGARPEIITQRFCLAACRALVVTPEGGVTTCFETYSRDHPLSEYFIVGHYKNGRFIIDKEKLNRRFSHIVEKIPYCSDCFCKWHCAGDCFIKTLNKGAHGEFQPTTRCFLTQELTKFLILDRIRKCGGLMWVGHNKCILKEENDADIQET